jgi:hypothetical protein
MDHFINRSKKIWDEVRGIKEVGLKEKRFQKANYKPHNSLGKKHDCVPAKQAQGG